LLRDRVDSTSCTAPSAAGVGAVRLSTTGPFAAQVATVSLNSSPWRTNARTAASRLDRTPACALL